MAAKAPRRKAKSAAKPKPKPTSKSLFRSKAKAVFPRPSPATPLLNRSATPQALAAPERDYLVIFEEPDPYGLPADDTLILDIEQPEQPARPEVDVQQKVAIELSNTTSRLGRFGFGLSGLGAGLGVGLMVWFSLVYPQDLLGAGNTSTMRTMILLSVLSLIMMVAGTMLTHYGRRIQARGRLSDVRIVEKSPHARASLK